MISRRRILHSATVAACLGLAGCSNEGPVGAGDDEPDGAGDDESPTQGTPPFEVVYNYGLYDSVPKASGDGQWESDDETQYVGVTVQVTNPGNEARPMGDEELWVLADGTSKDVNVITGQSELNRLDTEIEADETVTAWLLFAAPADAELGFGKSRFAEFSYDFRRDESIAPPRFDRQ